MAAGFVFPPGVVALAGSRRLPVSGVSRVQGVVSSLLEGGCSLVLGCCVGADRAALGCCSPAQARVLAAFGPAGQGACAWSAVSAVLAHAAAGGAVIWWAGGGPRMPLRRRLAARSAAVARAATSGAVVFLASPSSRGSLIVALGVARRGLPVIAFPLGFSASALPLLGTQGRWVPVSSGVLGRGWRWEESSCLFQGHQNHLQ